MHRDKRLLATSRAAWIAGFEGRKISAKLVSVLMGGDVGAVWGNEWIWRNLRQRRIRPKNG